MKPLEIINISEEQKNNLCNELAKLVTEFKEDETIECIYFAPYKGFDSTIDEVIELTLVRNNETPEDKENTAQRNSEYKESEALKKFGIKIVIDHDNARKYCKMAVSKSEVSRNNCLFNSTILFDRTGKYTKIKEVEEKYGVNKPGGIFYYDNLAKILPPITDELISTINRNEKKSSSEKVYTKKTN